MKLKEKLGREAGYRNMYMGIMENLGNELDAYLAGFEKARQMVLKLCDDCEESDPMVKSGYYFNEDIKALGEEEVSE
jgi:hypothetical protein